MINKNLLAAEVQQFLQENKGLNPSELALKKSKFSEVSSKELAQQLTGKQKAKQKLPTWYHNREVIYPPSLNLEQTSSEKTAVYKANLVSGNKLVDVTGGLGVDSVAFSKSVGQVYHCELNTDLQTIAQHNFKVLEANNITAINGDGVAFARMQPDIDWIYIDPSRRSKTKGKVFFLEDCEPNVPLILEDLLQTKAFILVKTAPILDITVGLQAMKHTSEIHVVAVNNEVKELLWVIDAKITITPTIYMVTLNEQFSNRVQVPLSIEATSKATYSAPMQYIYEPYAACRKAGVFQWLSQEYKVAKLHVNTHLYTSDNLLDFPGRIFKVIAVLPYHKSIMKALVNSKTNVVTKNFKLSVADIRKKYKLKEGLNDYLFFVTDINNQPVVIQCLKIDK